MDGRIKVRAAARVQLIAVGSRKIGRRSSALMGTEIRRLMQIETFCGSWHGLCLARAAYSVEAAPGWPGVARQKPSYSAAMPSNNPVRLARGIDGSSARADGRSRWPREHACSGLRSAGEWALDPIP